jgi:hypothetical protein
MAAVITRPLPRQSLGVVPDAGSPHFGLPAQGLAARWCVFRVLVLRHAFPMLLRVQRPSG